MRSPKRREFLPELREELARRIPMARPAALEMIEAWERGEDPPPHHLGRGVFAVCDQVSRSLDLLVEEDAPEEDLAAAAAHARAIEKWLRHPRNADQLLRKLGPDWLELLRKAGAMMDRPIRWGLAGSRWYFWRDPAGNAPTLEREVAALEVAIELEPFTSPEVRDA